ncbi:ATP-binding protein [Timonella sp. A28]|uniref:ATP-binding protein n=1 Tax=Timonella sp. A28 TaxID=3442640 RepID=UPI003EC05CCF
MSLYLPNVDPSPRLPLRRPIEGQRVSGVCAGLSLHLGIPVKTIRNVFIILTLAAGVGVVLYIFFALTIPRGDPHALAKDLSLDVRLRPALTGEEKPPVQPWWQAIPLRDITVGVIFVAITALLIADRLGAHLDWTWVLAGVVVVVGLFLAWGQLDSRRRGEFLEQTGGKTPMGVVRVVAGVALVVLGALLVVGQDSGGRLMWQALVASVAVLAGVGLVLAPWWLRTLNALGEERAAREIARQRADIAAHLHDSVLQTLALIQRSADRPGEVTRLARNQERELREWLYNDRVIPGTSLAQAAQDAVAQVENSMTLDLGGAETVSIDLVVVGDMEPEDGTDALLNAMSEALKNAVRHGAPPVSAYLEISQNSVEAYVTDRGTGFDLDMLDDVAPDRFGVRESIIGRMERRGGTVKFRNMARGGTEVHLSMPRKTTDIASHNATCEQKKGS